MRKVKLIIALLALVGSVMAQDEFSIGIKGGLTSSDIYYNEQIESDSRLGFTGGLFFQIPIGKFVGIQPEVLYTQRTILAKGTSFGSSFSFQRTTSAIDVPLYLQLRPVKYITILGGPQYSFNLTKTDQFKDGRITDEEKQTIVENDMRSGTFGVAVGADLNLGMFVFSGRIGWDLQSNTVNTTSFSPRYNYRWMQGTIGIRF
jgi:hypothetical protein